MTLIDQVNVTNKLVWWVNDEGSRLVISNEGQLTEYSIYQYRIAKFFL